MVVLELLNVTDLAIVPFVIGLALLGSCILGFITLSGRFLCHSDHLVYHTARLAQIKVIIFVFAFNKSLTGPLGIVLLSTVGDEVL